MKFRPVFLVLSTALLISPVLCARATSAQGPGVGEAGAGAPGPQGRRQSFDPLAIYRAAGVSKEQEGEIRRLAKDFESNLKVKLARWKNLLLEMRDFQLQPDPDPQKVLAKQDEINAVDNEIKTGRVKLMLKIRSLLTPQQKQKLVALVKQESEKQQALQGAR